MMSRMFLIGFGHGWFVAPNSAAAISSVSAAYMGMQSAMMNIARTLGFAMGPTLAALVWSPDNRFAADGMRKVFYVLLSVQLLTLLSIAGYRTTKVSTVKGSRHPAY